MIKSWLNIWKNIFDYTGKAKRKEYWGACIMNVPTMFVFVIPFAFIIKALAVSPELASTVFLIAFHIPTIALYFRRARDAGWKASTAIFMAASMPVISGIIVGAFPSVHNEHRYPRFYSFAGKIAALGFGLFFYGGIFGIILYNDVTALPSVSTSGILLCTADLIFIAYKTFF